MTFEEKGVMRQEAAYNIGWAVKMFENSCDICACTGQHIHCHSCKIATAHKEAIERITIRR